MDTHKKESKYFEYGNKTLPKKNYKYVMFRMIHRNNLNI